MTIENITRATIKITFEADWYDWPSDVDKEYYRDDLTAVFRVLT
jgi:hypothetical protein